MAGFFSQASEKMEADAINKRKMRLDIFSSFSYGFIMLEIQGLHKNFGQKPALLDIHLKIEKGEFLTWLGPSGCGKTTLLRCLAGLETPTAGEILLDGQSLLPISPQERPFHLVFQRYALFPHMTVEENIEFPLKVKKVNPSQRKARVQSLMEMMGLEPQRLQKPATLSGGQSQRVALARALADQPQILLLDEPLSALDEKIRTHLRQELKNLQKQVGITFIFVTHDQQEALQISDRIAVFNSGRIEQVGAPKDIYEKPQTDFVARFIGSKNLIQETHQERHYLYPEHIYVSGSGDRIFEAQVESLAYMGRDVQIEIRHKESLWRVILPSQQAKHLQPGQSHMFSYHSQDLMRVPKP